MLSSTKNVENKLYRVIEFKSTYCIDPGFDFGGAARWVEFENAQQTPFVVLSARCLYLLVEVELADKARAEPLRVKCHIRATNLHVAEVVGLQVAVLVLCVHMFHFARFFPLLVAQVVQVHVVVPALALHLLLVLRLVVECEDTLSFVRHRHKDDRICCFVFRICEALQICDRFIDKGRAVRFYGIRVP